MLAKYYISILFQNECLNILDRYYKNYNYHGNNDNVVDDDIDDEKLLFMYLFKYTLKIFFIDGILENVSTMVTLNFCRLTHCKIFALMR